MRIITESFTVYTWQDAPENVKQAILEKHSDINVDYEWWEGIYEDAENIGLKITSFDIDRASYCKGDFLHIPLLIAKQIIAEHSENCDTVITAKDYLQEYSRLMTENCQDDADFFCEPGNIAWIEAYLWENDDIDTQEIDEYFLKMLCEDYRIMLSKEYEYLTSEEAIIETLIANEY